MLVYLLRCDQCGAATIMPEGDTVLQPDNITLDPDMGEVEPISRCAIVYQLDSGAEACEGNVAVFARLDVHPLT